MGGSRRPAGRTSVLSAPGANRPAHVAVVLYVVATVLLAVIARPLWQPLVLAVVLAAPLASVNDRAARALGGRRTLAAALFTTGAILIIVLPIAAAALFVVDQAIDLANVVKTTLKQSGVAGLLEPLPDSIAQWLQHLQTQVPTRPRELLSRVNGWSQSGWALGAVAGLLRDGHALQGWLKTKSPIGAENVERLGRELSAVSKSVIGGNLATGAAQSVVATIGYLIARAPSPFLLGLLTFLAS